MAEVSLDELGPVDYIVVEFPAGASNFTGEMVEELLAPGAHLGEPLGSTIRFGGPAFGWPADRQWTDTDSGDHRLHRSRRSTRDLRRLKCRSDLRREAFSMSMYVSIVLLSARSVFDDAHPPSERDVLLLEVGTTVGLVLAHGSSRAAPATRHSGPRCTACWCSSVASPSPGSERCSCTESPRWGDLRVALKVGLSVPAVGCSIVSKSPRSRPPAVLDPDGSLSQVGGRLPFVDRRVITAAEFERLTPAERDAAFEASIVWDLADAPPELVARARARVEERITRDERQTAE